MSTKTIPTILQEKFGDRIKTDVILAPYTTFKIGGPADFFFEARTADELVDAITIGSAAGVPVTLLGGGSNILVSDEGIRGFVIRNLTHHIGLKGIKGVKGMDGARELVYVESDSGVPFNQLVRFTCDEGLSGLEMHLGLPGTVGGAVSMNSKWMNPKGFVGDAVFQARIIDQHGTDTVVDHTYFDFSYGHSIVSERGVFLISVIFELTRSTKERVWKTANESIAYRRTSQPQGIRSAGCAFKNIEKEEALSAATPNGTTSAGFLIDHAGLKGTTIGGAAVSTQHANFIQNTGTASASDVVKLMDLIRTTVNEKFGVTLRDELIRIGEF
jgi:UDP-N-acetylmuramate dehydrogenase